MFDKFDRKSYLSLNKSNKFVRKFMWKLRWKLTNSAFSWQASHNSIKCHKKIQNVLRTRNYVGSIILVEKIIFPISIEFLQFVFLLLWLRHYSFYSENYSSELEFHWFLLRILNIYKIFKGRYQFFFILGKII